VPVAGTVFRGDDNLDIVWLELASLGADGCAFYDVHGTAERVSVFHMLTAPEVISVGTGQSGRAHEFAPVRDEFVALFFSFCAVLCVPLAQW
jgi:hypothetical protein